MQMPIQACDAREGKPYLWHAQFSKTVYRPCTKDSAFCPHSQHPFFPLPTSHFSRSLCSTNQSRKPLPKQISLLLRAHLYCILHQTVNTALQCLLKNGPKLKQISILCCHFSPSSYSNRCFLLEWLYTILGRPY